MRDRDPIVPPFHVIGLDPGGTTGWGRVLFRPSRPTRMSELHLSDFILTTGELRGEFHHDTLYRMMEERWNDYPDLRPEFVTEPFQFRQYAEAKRSDVELISREYIGVMRLFCQHHARDLPHAPTLYDRFNAGQAKDYVPNLKLEKIGWLVTPQHPNRHRNDALRQIVKYLVVEKRIRHPITSAWKDDEAA